jgi:hypothetical protein
MMSNWLSKHHFWLLLLLLRRRRLIHTTDLITIEAFDKIR